MLIPADLLTFPPRCGLKLRLAWCEWACCMWCMEVPDGCLAKTLDGTTCTELSLVGDLCWYRDREGGANGNKLD